MKLYDYKDDAEFKYLICEYCDGGDLLNYQAQQKNKVFTLERATEIMAEIVKGLEYIHSKNYLHRDIKSQNILVKNLPNDQKVKNYLSSNLKLQISDSPSHSAKLTEPSSEQNLSWLPKYSTLISTSTKSISGQWAFSSTSCSTWSSPSVPPLLIIEFNNPHATNEEKRD